MELFLAPSLSVSTLRKTNHRCEPWNQIAWTLSPPDHAGVTIHFLASCSLSIKWDRNSFYLIILSWGLNESDPSKGLAYFLELLFIIVITGYYYLKTIIPLLIMVWCFYAMKKNFYVFSSSWSVSSFFFTPVSVFIHPSNIYRSPIKGQVPS